jgi:HAD superfamily hydrolase (TIGR01549 family)
MTYKNYIWDFDGTLYDTYEVMTNAFLQALGEFKVFPPYEEAYQWMKKESVRYAAELYVGAEKKPSLIERYHEIEHTIQREPLPFEETRAVIEELSKRGAKNFILTHRDGTVSEFLAQDGLLDYFTEIINAKDGFPAKPAPDSLNYIIEKHHLKKPESVMVGDRSLDILAGKNAGIDTILYDIDGFLGEIPATYTVHHLKDILQITKD